MGYIPPAGDSSGPNPPTGSSSTITIPNPATFLPKNPSIGLKIWGPLVPASDNKMALFQLTGVQTLLGVWILYRGMQLRNRRLLLVGRPVNTETRIRKWLLVATGSTLVFQSGLEVSRIILPYDPWVEELRFYRRQALKNGETVSWWFGAYKYYTPMGFDQWNAKMQLWLQKAEAGLVSLSPRHSHLAALLLNNKNYAQVYQSLRESNLQNYKKTLAGDLGQVTELNKAERLDAIMEGKYRLAYNENYYKPHIQLGNYTMEDDDEFEMVWQNFDPWDELKMETDYDIRLLPRWRWQEDVEETPEEPVLA